ncbi:MAG: hypothetical protein GEU88_21040 [Solirubrobacterales bacterium]|nr:hypothetical protein [Solirubrobacterales bacterium]
MVSADRTRDVVEPTADDVFECARGAVCRVMEVEPAAVIAPLRLVEELGADSLAIIEMAEVMEEEMTRRFRLRVSVDDVALMTTRTVGGLVDELRRALRAARASHGTLSVDVPRDGTRGE